VQSAAVPSASVDISGWILKDDKDTSKFPVPAGTTLAARSFRAFDVHNAFGLGAADEARLFLPDGSGGWTPDTTAGWSSGKSLHYPSGTGTPDDEGVTLTGAGSTGGVYVASERNNDASGTSRTSVLRYDVSGTGTTLNATQEWNLTADLPAVGANLGFGPTAEPGVRTGLSADDAIMWTGRKVTPGFFVEHMREEMVLHRWDMTGDDVTAVHSLMQPWMASHSVWQVGKPLLQRGIAGLDLVPGERIEGRLRSPGTDDILVTASSDGNTIGLSRWHSQAGPHALRQIRTLLSGY
jgi:hypothetical protein